MKTKSLLLATALLMSTSAFAQKNTFKGVVLDDLGEPVIGATVQVKGVKGAGAITDLDGNFVIDADANFLRYRACCHRALSDFCPLR